MTFLRVAGLAKEDFFEKVDLPLVPKVALYNKVQELKEELKKLEEETAEDLPEGEEAGGEEGAGGEVEDPKEFFFEKGVIPRNRVVRKGKMEVEGFHTGFIKPKHKQKKGEPSRKRAIMLRLLLVKQASDTDRIATLV